MRASKLVLCVQIADLAKAHLSWQVQGGWYLFTANLRSSLQWVLGIINICHNFHSNVEYSLYAFHMLYMCNQSIALIHNVKLDIRKLRYKGHGHYLECMKCP